MCPYGILNMLIDTHCHLDFPEFDSDRAEVIKRAKDSGIECMINAGSSVVGSRKSLELARQYDFVYATSGIHPHEAGAATREDQEAIRKLGKEPKVVAIGEIGLDYFKNFSPPEKQRPLFISLVKIAKDLGLPLVIHSRAAETDTLKILKEAMPVRAVVHCFSSDADFLERCLTVGFYISFTCNVTYPKAADLREVLKRVPMDRLMLETDAPYLSPQGARGKRNEPGNVAVLAREVAALRQVSMEEIAAATTANARKFFNLK